MLATVDTSDLMIFLFVVGLRLFVPLLIPRFPLPAIIACLVIDAVDQTIFQQYTNLDLEGYQTYDKALDIYYLTVAYTSTMRNWSGSFVFEVGRFLWYYRLVGVLLFEYTQHRWLLLVFPNTFEYYFIAIEYLKTRRNPFSLTHRTVIVIAGMIWVFVKLPQEWWIHVAQNDFTDFAKQTVFGVEPDDGWGTALTNRPLVTIGLIVAIGGAVLWLRRASASLPAAEWKRTYDSDRQGESLGWTPPSKAAVPTAGWGKPFVEKVILVGFVSSIFSRILPDVEAGPVAITLAVGVVIAVNTLISEYLARREVSWRSTGIEFAVMGALNTVTVLVFFFMSGGDDDGLHLANTLFFVALLTLIVVLFDRYRDIGSMRRECPAAPPAGV